MASCTALDANDPQKSQQDCGPFPEPSRGNDGLVFTAYRVVNPTGNEAGTLDTCGSLVFDVPDTLVCTYPSRSRTLHQRWLDGQLFTSYPTDGIVVKVYDHDLQRKMGETSGQKPCPHWALALKR